MKHTRTTYIHQRVQELGFHGVGEYLAQRWTIEQRRAEDIADECNVRVNTIRRYLKLYGFSQPRRKRTPGTRRGRNIICVACGAARYYAPSIIVKLDERTYKCRPCKNVELRKSHLSQEDHQGVDASAQCLDSYDPVES